MGCKRELSKINYKIHTDAIKKNLIPKELTKYETKIIYAEEVAILNGIVWNESGAMERKEFR